MRLMTITILLLEPGDLSPGICITVAGLGV